MLWKMGEKNNWKWKQNWQTDKLLQIYFTSETFAFVHFLCKFENIKDNVTVNNNAEGKMFTAIFFLYFNYYTGQLLVLTHVSTSSKSH